MKKIPKMVSLELLASFVNFLIDRRSFKKSWVYQALQFIMGTSPRITALKDLQCELRQYLTPLVSLPIEPDRDSSNAYKRIRAPLERLLVKINEVGLTPSWFASYGVYRFPRALKVESRGKIKYYDVKNSALKRLGQGHRILLLQNTKWIIEMNFRAADLTGQFYGCIISALEDGSLRRLKICPVCKKFFVAKILPKVFCNKSCTRSFYDKKGTSRVQKSRRKKRYSEEKEIRSILSQMTSKNKEQWMEESYGQFDDIITGKKRVDSLTPRERRDFLESYKPEPKADRNIPAFR